MGKWGWIILVWLIFPWPVQALYVNEVNYAPFAGSEWVELYNPGPEINLSSWTFADNSSVDSIECCLPGCSQSIASQQFVIVTSQGSSLLNETSNLTIVCVDDNSLGNGLGNEQDTIILSNGSYQTIFTYDQSLGANRNNKTLELRADGTWGESLFTGGTPGKENSIFSAAADYQLLQLSEVMPNPFDADDDPKPWGEWVELYNSGSKTLYLGGLILKDSEEDHELIISEDKVEDVKDLFLYPQGFVVIYRDGDSDFSLNNDEYEEVRLYYHDTLLDSMSYAGSTEGMTWGLVENSWYKTILTPYEENFLEKECDWLLQFTLNDSVARPEDFSFKVSLLRDFGFPENLTVLGEITDVNGEVVRQYTPWTNEHTISERHKVYSPNLPEGYYRLHFWMKSWQCLEYDDTDNDISQLFSINPHYEEFAPDLTLGTISVGSDGKVRWGEQFLVTVQVYKGNETDSQIELWAEQDGKRVSSITSLRLAGTFRNYPLTLPIQLYPNCEEELDENTITVRVRGFGKEDSATVTIDGVDGDFCQEVEVEKGGAKTSAVQYRPLEVPLFFQMGQSQSLPWEIVNGKEEHRYMIWAYMYRGKKCYSCQGLPQEINAREVFLNPDETRVVVINVTPDAEAEEGEYNLKIKIRRDAQVTAKEFTFPIKVRRMIQQQKLSLPLMFSTGKNSSEEELQPILLPERAERGEIQERVVYQSSSQKAAGMLPALLLATFMLLGLVLWPERRKA